MVYIHPSVISKPSRILRLELATGLRAVTHRGRAVLVQRPDLAQQSLQSRPAP